MPSAGLHLLLMGNARINPFQIIIVLVMTMHVRLMVVMMETNTVCCKEHRRQGRLWCKGLEQVYCGTGLEKKTMNFLEYPFNVKMLKRSKKKKPISPESFSWPLLSMRKTLYWRRDPPIFSFLKKVSGIHTYHPKCQYHHSGCFKVQSQISQINRA